MRVCISKVLALVLIIACSSGCQISLQKQSETPEKRLARLEDETSNARTKILEVSEAMEKLWPQMVTDAAAEKWLASAIRDENTPGSLRPRLCEDYRVVWQTVLDQIKHLKYELYCATKSINAALDLAPSLTQNVEAMNAHVARIKELDDQLDQYKNAWYLGRVQRWQQLKHPFKK